MLTFVRYATVLLAVVAGLSGCGMADDREVYHGRNGEAVAAIVRAIDGAQRSVLARSPALPRSAVSEALAAARRRGVLVEFVICGDQPALEATESRRRAASHLPIRFDPTHHASGGAVFVIDARTVVRTSYRRNRGGAEAAMIIRENPKLGEQVAAECRSHVARATSSTRPTSH